MRIHLYGRTDLQIGHETIQQKKNAQTNRIKNNTQQNTFHETNPFDSYTTSIASYWVL